MAVFTDCCHTTITDVQYSRQLADSYSPVLLNECIDAVTVLACYGSPRPVLMRFILHHFFPFLNALLHLWTLTFDSVFSPYCLFNLEQISDGLQPSFVRNLIIMRCSTLTCTLDSLSFLTINKIAQ